MCAIASIPRRFIAARALVMRSCGAALLVSLGLALALVTAFLTSNERRRSAEPMCYCVAGKVLVDGEPAENVQVAFHPLHGDKNKFCPVGRTNSKGHFRLTTRRHADGAPAGEYKVTLIWPDGSCDDCECADAFQHDRLLGLYARVDESAFHVSVGASDNTFWFHASRPHSNLAPLTVAERPGRTVAGPRSGRFAGTPHVGVLVGSKMSER